MGNTETITTDLATSIKRWQIGIGLYVGLTFIAYLGWFAVKLSNGLSRDVAAWGQAGDFFGGMLNPVVALAAFFWLTKGVELQKQELSETRLALAGAMEAQKEQAESAAATVRLSALTALINSCSSEINVLRQNIEFQLSQIGGGRGIWSIDGQQVTPNDALNIVAALSASINETLENKSFYEMQIKALLSEAR